MMMELMPWLLAWGFVALIMVAFWIIEYRMANASYIDVGWTFGIALTTVMVAVSAQGWPLRKYCLCALVLCWSLRLGIHLLRRITRDPHEDKRYAQLRSAWAEHAHKRFFLLFQFQALLAVLLCVGFYPSLNDAFPKWHLMQTIGVLTWVIGFVGETIADAQLKAFKSNALNKGKTCAVGLWNYSRHPNYFFEWVMWVGYALYGASSDYGWMGIISVAVMLWFLTKLTGIPYSEQMALQTRGDDYRQYQRRTSMFFPWFKR